MDALKLKELRTFPLFVDGGVVVYSKPFSTRISLKESIATEEFPAYTGTLSNRNSGFKSYLSVCPVVVSVMAI